MLVLIIWTKILFKVIRVIRAVKFRVLLRLFRLLWNGKARGFVSEVRHVDGDAPRGVACTRI